MSEYLDDTFTKSIKQNGYTGAEILAKYPHLVSRASMLRAITDSGLAANTQRNPTGYTAAELTELVIEYWDTIISAWWPETYSALVYQYVNSRWKMNQAEYWKDSGWSMIYHTGDDAGDAGTILVNTHIVILPGNYYDQENIQNYRNKTWLGFDNFMMRSNFAVELTNTAGIIQGVTVGGLTDDDANNPITNTNLKPSFMVVYSNQIWHPTLAPNGTYNSVSTDADPVEWADPTTSTRYFDLSHAIFDITVSGGVVTSVTAQSRLDGTGLSVTGGWNYNDSDDYRQMQILSSVTGTSTDWALPRILVRTNEDQPGYPSNRATVDITQPDQEFFAGKNIVDGVYTGILTGFKTGYAGAASRDLTTNTLYNHDVWYDRNWPAEPRVRDVRMTVNRPVMRTQSRSLRETRISTGGHAITFEYSYAPMTYENAEILMRAYEVCHGAGQSMQIFIPKEVIEYQEMRFDSEFPKVARRGVIQSPTGNVGSQEIVIDGFESGYSIPHNDYFYFLLGEASKLYKVIDHQTADAYGRMTFRIEPPLLTDHNDYAVECAVDYNLHPAPARRLSHIPMQAYIVDDSFDVSVDAAGLYRISIKFVEALT